MGVLLDLESKNTHSGMDEYEKKQAQRLAYYEVLVRAGPLWKESLLLHLALCCQNGDGKSTMSVEKAINGFNRLQSKIRNLSLESEGSGNYGNIFGLHPLLTGWELMNDTLPRLSQGKSFRLVMEEQERWQ